MSGQEKRYLGFLRHADATGSFIDGDAARSLSDIGKRQVYELRKRILETSIRFDCMVCSDAVRTRQTAQGLILPELFLGKIHIEVASSRDFFSTARLGGLIESYLHQQLSILFVGHNPAISTVASQYARGFYSFPPCACLVIDQRLFEIQFTHRL